MGPKTTNPADLVYGGILQCAEAITLGMPFEVILAHFMPSLHIFFLSYVAQGMENKNGC
jgi:hypothetical protein